MHSPVQGIFAPKMGFASREIRTALVRARFRRVYRFSVKGPARCIKHDFEMWNTDEVLYNVLNP